MSPNQQTGVLFETDDHVETETINFDQNPRQYKIIWKNVFALIYMHITGFYAMYLMFTSAKLLTTVFAFVCVMLGNIGAGSGSHRLFAHRSYKATTPLTIFLVVLQTMAFQDSVFIWSRNHRVHHKFSETHADPHNPKRGFFYAHIGWVLTKRHPASIEKLKSIDVSDLLNNPIIKFQNDYYAYLIVLLAIVLPTAIPMYFWGETFINAYCINIFRCCASLHIVFAINSFAHKFGNRSYDKYIYPSDNRIVSFFSFGDGFHNYHHVFPWDYRSSEFGKYAFNLNGAFIELCAKLGLAYDLKAPSEDMIRKRVIRTGDGSHYLWGWKDKDMPREDIQDAIVSNKRN